MSADPLNHYWWVSCGPTKHGTYTKDTDLVTCPNCITHIAEAVEWKLTPRLNPWWCDACQLLYSTTRCPQCGEPVEPKYT